MQTFKKLVQIFLAFTFLTQYSRASNLQEISYTFDQQKNQSAKNVFHFFRAYVDYFYLTIQANKSNLAAFEKASFFTGWCVGDAHPENFGFLIQKDNSAIFTINDMDDFGPCPVIYDLYRLMVSSRLYDEKIKLDQILKSYLSGLNSEQESMPSELFKLLNKSQKNGTQFDSKKIDSGKIIRNFGMTEVNSNTKNEISTALKNAQLGFSKNFSLVDLVQTRKAGGGSSGLLRYEILIDDDNQFTHLELKEQVKPAIYPVATDPIPDTEFRIQKAIQFEQGPMALPIYGSVKINSLGMLVRPHYTGNIRFNLSDNSVAINEKIISYEAYTLGQIHSRSVKQNDEYQKTIKNLNAADIENDVQAMINLFKQVFKKR
ncbi:MAG: DUF2252 family protein [Bdellovibrio sp.]|nr:DUF2252 family protein [Bdellovibrio sp.]